MLGAFDIDPASGAAARRAYETSLERWRSQTRKRLIEEGCPLFGGQRAVPPPPSLQLSADDLHATAVH